MSTDVQTLRPPPAVERSTPLIRRVPVAGAAVLAYGLAVISCVIAGEGLLYLLRQASVLGAGPAVRGALPLQHLAGSDAQPLLRVAVAWLPAAVVAGLILRSAGLRSRPARAAVAAAVAYAVLVPVGALSDAVMVTGRFGDFVGTQWGRAGTLAATGLMALGALVAGRRAASDRGRRGYAGWSTGDGAD
jgi:hypothetical protein